MFPVPDGTGEEADSEGATQPDTAAGPSKRPAVGRSRGSGSRPAPAAAAAAGEEEVRAANVGSELPLSVDEQQLRGMVAEVAAKSKALVSWRACRQLCALCSLGSN